jgi:hypothetical protein
LRSLRSLAVILTVLHQGGMPGADSLQMRMIDGINVDEKEFRSKYTERGDMEKATSKKVSARWEGGRKGETEGGTERRGEASARGGGCFECCANEETPSERANK